MNIPCKDCIVLSICQNSLGKKHIGEALTKLASKCYMIQDYLNLEDMGLKSPLNIIPMKDRMYFNQPFSKRILELFSFMNWKHHDLTRYEQLSKGIYKEFDNNGKDKRVHKL